MTASTHAANIWESLEALKPSLQELPEQPAGTVFELIREAQIQLLALRGRLSSLGIAQVQGLTVGQTYHRLGVAYVISGFDDEGYVLVTWSKNKSIRVEPMEFMGDDSKWTLAPTEAPSTGEHAPGN